MRSALAKSPCHTCKKFVTQSEFENSDSTTHGLEIRFASITPAKIAVSHRRELRATIITHSDDARWLIETERLQLRPVSTDDTALMLSVWNDPAFIRHVADRGIRTDEQAREAIETGAAKLFADFGYGPCCLCLKSTGALIGICGLFKRENLEDPDIGFSVLPDYCGQGYASEAASAVISYARDTVGITRLTAIVSPTNTPSIGLIEKLGLTFDRMITMPGEDTALRLYTL